MIFGLILILAIVIFLAFFIGKNLSFATTIWLFKTYEGINISVVVFAAFAAGIVFSIVCIFIYRLVMASKITPEVESERERLRRKKQQLKTEKQLARLAEKNAAREREKLKSELQAEIKSELNTGAAASEPPVLPPATQDKKASRRRLFSRKSTGQESPETEQKTENADKENNE